MYGVSEARILALLRRAYAQDYLYLIKKPNDQYQVILEEAEDAARSKPEDLGLLYIKSDDGKNLVPLSAVVTWKTSLGPQAVNHLNQFTSMMLFCNLAPGVAIGAATDFINKTAAEIVPPTVRASLQGEALTFRNTVSDLILLMALAVFIMYVILAILYESYLHPLTVLSTLPKTSVPHPRWSLKGKGFPLVTLGIGQDRTMAGCPLPGPILAYPTPSSASRASSSGWRRV
jgi:HAE1 family hydrophobic/amphiphilic exporter-1